MPFPAIFELSSLAAGDGSEGFVINGACAGDRSGVSVSAAGDVNGDGIADLIVGASSASPRGRYSGASYVVFGRGAEEPRDGVFELSSLSGGDGSKGFVINGVASQDFSGGSVSAAGDVNGDGIGDLIVGASHANGFAGASYVVFGHGEGDAIAAVFELSSVSGGGGSEGFVINGVASEDSAAVRSAQPGT